MTPFRFGPPARQLFGLVQSPTLKLHRNEFVILCNPFGQEAIRAHRFFRVLAERLLRVGFHVIRFDYFGTGDSDGDHADGNLETWIDDICNVEAEIRVRSGCTQGSFFGLRLGASIAALATSRTATAPRRLVLWDPVIYGAKYLDELVAANITAGRLSFGARWVLEEQLREMVSRESESEILGFPLSTGMREELRAILPIVFAGIRVGHVTILNGRASNHMDEIKSVLAASKVNLSIETVTSEIDWATHEAMNSAIVPVDIVQRIILALTDDK